MNVVQICEEDQEQAFELLSAILWLGNITFCVVEHDNHVVIEDDEGYYFYFSSYIVFLQEHSVIFFDFGAAAKVLFDSIIIFKNSYNVNMSDNMFA